MGNGPSNPPGNCVILDVNALMAPFQMGFNLDMEMSSVLPGYTMVVPTSVKRELATLIKTSNDWKLKAALQLGEKYDTVEVKGRGDSPIFNLAVNMGWAVCTMDRRLKNKLLERGVPVVLVRSRGHLELMEP